MKKYQELFKVVKALSGVIRKRATDEMLADVDPADLKEWMSMESIHGDEEMQRQIVADHIREHGIAFYPALKAFEYNFDKQNG